MFAGKPIILALSLLGIAAPASAKSTFSFGPPTARFSAQISARAGVYVKGPTSGTEARLRFDLALKGKLDNGLSYGASTIIDLQKDDRPKVNRPAYWISHGKTKLTFGNTSGAVAALAGVWGCAVGYRGASCADMVANMAPGGWSPVFSVGPLGPVGVGIVRVNTQLGDVKVAISGGGGSDPEIAAKFKVGAVNVGLGFDAGPGTSGGTTIILDLKRGDLTYGFDIGRYGNVTNLVASVQMKRDRTTWYAYASRLNRTNSIGLSFSRDLRKNVTFAAGIENVGGTFMADMGFKVRF